MQSISILVVFVQCELYHWVDLLDRFDLILDEAAQQSDEGQKPNESEDVTTCVFLCPKLENPKVSWQFDAGTRY